MGQPINVVEKPTSTPGLARFETNRSLTGMGHERYASIDDVLGHRPVDELARRLFDSGGVTQIHANGSMVTVHLTEGWTGEKLLDVIRGLYIFYPQADGSPAADADGAAPAGGDADAAAPAADEADVAAPAVGDADAAAPAADEGENAGAAPAADDATSESGSPE